MNSLFNSNHTLCSLCSNKITLTHHINSEPFDRNSIASNTDCHLPTWIPFEFMIPSGWNSVPCDVVCKHSHNISVWVAEASLKHF